MIALPATTLVMPAAAAPMTRVLIVGIDAYPFEPQANLKGAVKDARLIHDRLSRPPYSLALGNFPNGGDCKVGDAAVRAPLRVRHSPPQG